jgi:aquaporin Z
LAFDQPQYLSLLIQLGIRSGMKASAASMSLQSSVSESAFDGAAAAISAHWPEYLMEAAELGIFMISACAFGALLFHPESPVVAALPSVFARRALIGTAMGLTAISIVYSPIGKRSGAHFNPSVTLTFCRLGRVAPWDAVFYMVAQMIGSALGVAAAAFVLRKMLSHPAVNFVATVPGSTGVYVAFAAEFVIAFILMTVVLNVSSRDAISRYTGLFAGMLVATFITFEAPYSGMSMNPARTFGSAVSANLWTSIWIYFLAPPAAMLLAAEVFLKVRGRIGCAKLHHTNNKRCIFCEYQQWKNKEPEA